MTARDPEADRLYAEYLRTGRALKALSGGGHMGLTPDHVKASPEYRAAKKAADLAFAQLRNYRAPK